jgi:hypothetical protein
MVEFQDLLKLRAYYKVRDKLPVRRLNCPSHWHATYLVSTMADYLQRRCLLACPFFMPTRKLAAQDLWPHPFRLPLGAGWRGFCCAPGHEGIRLSHQELRECNLGYALTCPRLPHTRECDSVRFGVAHDSGVKLLLWFTCEAGHRPVRNGTLEFDRLLNLWTATDPDPRIQKMAECYLESYLARKPQPGAAEFAAGQGS